MLATSTQKVSTKKHSEITADDLILMVAQQLIMDNKTKDKQQCEFFIRSITQDQKLIFPFETIQCFKDDRRYNEITRFVFERALEVIEEDRIGIHINIGTEDILGETGRYIEETLIRNKNLAPYLTLEVLEECELLEQTKTKAFFNRVRSQGSKIAIDDFGKSFCNYSRLLDVEFDLLKIDGGLTKNVDQCDKRAYLLESLQGFAEKTKTDIIAEQVETKQEQQKIVSLGIAYSQGYYIHKPKIRGLDDFYKRG